MSRIAKNILMLKCLSRIQIIVCICIGSFSFTLFHGTAEANSNGLVAVSFIVGAICYISRFHR